VLAPELREGRAAVGGQVDAGDRDLAVVRSVQACDQVQERRLPAARRADERVEGAGFERQADAGDRVDRLGLSGEPASYVLEADELLSAARRGLGRCLDQAWGGGAAQDHGAGGEAHLGVPRDAGGLEVVRVQPEQPAVVDEHEGAPAAPVQRAGDAAVADGDRAVRDLRRARIVRGQDHGRVALVGELGQQLQDAAAGGGVELAGDLVYEQELRPRGDRDAQRRALLLAARELLAAGVPALLQPDPLEQLVRATAGGACAHSGKARSQRDPLGDGLVVPECLRGVLGDGRHRRCRVQVPGGDRLQPGEAVQERGLPGATRAHHRDELAVLDGQARPLQADDVAGRAVVDDEHLARLDRVVVVRHAAPPHGGMPGNYRHAQVSGHTPTPEAACAHARPMHGRPGSARPSSVPAVRRPRPAAP
jgi:hypothetical protein